MTDTFTPQRRQALPLVNLAASIGAAILAVTALTVALDQDSASLPRATPARVEVVSPAPAVAAGTPDVARRVGFYGCDGQFGTTRC